MTMDVRFELLWPEFLVAGLAFLVFALDFVIRPARKDILAWVSVAGLAAIIAFTVPFLLNEHDSLFSGLYRVDSYALFFKVLSMGVGIAVIMGSLHYVNKHLTHPGEYYAIIVVSVLAMMMMAASGELLTAYLSLELLSFCLYILSGYALHDRRSNEASVKYVLLGAFSSGLLLYGIVLLYGALGTTHFAEMAAGISTPRATSTDGCWWGSRLWWPGSASSWRRCPSTCGRPTSTRARRCPSRPTSPWGPRPRPSPSCCASSTRASPPPTTSGRCSLRAWPR